MKRNVFLFIFLLVCSSPAIAEVIGIETEGLGFPLSPNAPEGVRKQEAFVAALVDGLKNLVEARNWSSMQSAIVNQIADPFAWKKDEITVSVYETLGDFQVRSETVLTGRSKIVNKTIFCQYKKQQIIVKNSQLLFTLPVALLNFPQWDHPPEVISKIKIHHVDWEWDRFKLGWWCRLQLSYRFESPL